MEWRKGRLYCMIHWPRVPDSPSTQIVSWELSQRAVSEAAERRRKPPQECLVFGGPPVPVPKYGLYCTIKRAAGKAKALEGSYGPGEPTKRTAPNDRMSVTDSQSLTL